MAIKALWYLSMADGRYPWMEDGFFGVDFDRYRRLAETIDRGGFYGALVATWPNDPLVSASSVASYTKTMRFLVASYAGMTPAKLLAEQALTFDALTGGRLMFNHINGREERVKTYNISMSSDDRYRLGEDYWHEFQQHYRAGNPSLFPNTRFKIEPARAEGVELWGTGESPAGVVHAGKVVDVYLLMLRELGEITDKFQKARQAAEAHRRSFSDMGALASVIIRKSRSEAEKHFYSIFETTGADLLRAKLEEVVRRRSTGEQTLATYKAPDARRQEWVNYLLAGKLPPLESLRLEHSVFAGMSAWSSLDIFGTGSSAAYFVGDPDAIATNVELYSKQAGLTALILSGWPLIEEAQNVADLLIPRLDEIG
jgi:alkanesulfonate monooxygenase